MSKPTLYLMLGYPGAGKTTISKIIHELTGAVHLWADKIRREQFSQPTHSHAENIALYSHLNVVAGEILAADQSVIFDTNFNFYKDREKLRKIADEHGAKTITVWVTTKKDLAKRRATKEAHENETRILGDMPPEKFERIASNLEKPRENEKIIEINGEGVTPQLIKQKLGLS